MRSLAALAVVAGCSSAPAPPGVGVASRTYVDATRPTPANGVAPALPQRTLPTEIWYPAPLGTPGPELENAPLADGGPFPLVIFVHGSGTSRRQSTFLTVALAAAGYVVMAADHPLTAGSTPGGASDLHVEDEAGDVALLADRAAAFAADPADPLHGAIDPQAGYAVVGHSTGGTVALLMAYGDAHDDRVRAVVSISGDSCFFSAGFFATRSVPVLSLTGSNDLLVPPPNNARRTYDLARGPKVFASLVGGNHMYFTDFDLPDELLHSPPTDATSDLAVTLARYGDGAACSPVPPPAGDPQLALADQQVRAAQIVTAYLAHVLRAADLDLESDATVVVEQAP